MKRTLLLSSLALPLLACGPQPDAPALATSTAALTISNGHELNGHELNGHELNGHELNGHELNGHELNGHELNGHELNGHELNGSKLGGADVTTASLEGSELVLTVGEGQQVRGTAVVGAELITEDSLRVRIDSARVDPDPGQGDVWMYTVMAQVGDRWAPLCGTDEAGIPLEAIPLTGRWDYRQGVPGGGDHLAEPGVFTFACEEGALAKCVHFGYAPWRSAQSCDASGNCTTVSLADYHQACTRMVRADYCGNGRSYTRDGMLIDVYDGIGIQGDTDPWPFEAEWSPNGAVCLDHFRISNRTTVPSCKRDLQDATCGDPSHFQTGTLLMTEYSPDDIVGAPHRQDRGANP